MKKERSLQFTRKQVPSNADIRTVVVWTAANVHQLWHASLQLISDGVHCIGPHTHMRAIMSHSSMKPKELHGKKKHRKWCWRTDEWIQYHAKTSEQQCIAARPEWPYQHSNGVQVLFCEDPTNCDPASPLQYNCNRRTHQMPAANDFLRLVQRFIWPLRS